MSNELGAANSSGLRQYLRPTRREVLLGGGVALIGLTHNDSVFAGLSGLGQAASFPGVTTVSGARKPVFVPATGSTDPVAHSLAESLFWLDQEFEHAKFFLMHMPSPDLDAERAQVMQSKPSSTAPSTPCATSSSARAGSSSRSRASGRRA